MIDLHNADIDKAMPFLIRAGIQNAGQTCSASSRILVQRSIYKKVENLMIENYKRLSIGPAIQNYDVGPLISKRQFKVVKNFINQGQDLNKIAECHLDKTLPSGFYFQPTLFGDVKPSHILAQEEIFGPVQVLISFKDEQEAIEIANGTKYGLVASILTNDASRQMRLPKLIKAGQIFVNILTPLAMIKEMKLGTGDLVLQTAAGSVVGKVMIQLGQIFGFETINIVRRQETANEIIDLYGSNRVYVHDGTSSAEERLQNKIRNDIGDASIKYAIDAVSGEVGRFCLRMLDSGGLVYYYGALSGDPMVPVNIVTDLCRDNKTVKGWSIQETWLRSVSDSTKRTCVDEIWKFLSNKTIVLPPVGDKFPLEQVRHAIISSKKPQKKGKIMLVLDS